MSSKITIKLVVSLLFFISSFGFPNLSKANNPFYSAELKKVSTFKKTIIIFSDSFIERRDTTGDEARLTFKISKEKNEPVEVEERIFPVFSDEMMISAGGVWSKKPIDPILTEKVFINVRKHYKMKTFTISFLDYKTIMPKEIECKKFDELKLLQKHVWLYEGSEVEKMYTLLDSIEKRIIRRHKYSERRNRKNQHFSPRRYELQGPTAISDLSIKRNPDADNFLLKLVVFEEEITIPISIVTNTTNSKKIQKTYDSFFLSYNDKNKERCSKWETIDDNKKVKNKNWTNEEIAIGTDYKRKYKRKDLAELNGWGERLFYLKKTSNPRLPPIAYYNNNGEALEIETIYVLDYTNSNAYVFKRERDAFYFPLHQNAIIVELKDGRLGLVNSNDFLSTMISGELRDLQFTLYDPEENSFSELQDLGNVN